MKEGLNIVSEIAKYINNGRYTTNINKFSPLSIVNIHKVLELSLPVSLTQEMRHVNLAQAFFFCFFFILTFPLLVLLLVPMPVGS